MRNFMNSPGLHGKIIITVVTSVIAAVAVLTVLIIHREIELLEADGRKNAEILAMTISTALRDNMLAGRTDDTVRLMRELSVIPGVEEIAVLSLTGRRAFGQPGGEPDIGSEALFRMRNGQETAVSTANAFSLGNCIKCRVYKEFRGDEIRQLEDGFNRMSLTLKINEKNLKRRVSEVNSLNRDLERNNVKLTTLLDASKLMTSTLELDQVLTDSMRIILNATDLKAGLILLLEEDLDKRCYEYFGCKAYNCPAYNAAVNCWLLSATMCHGEPSACPENTAASECWGNRRIHSHLRPARDYDEKMKACSVCEFFSSIVLIPRMATGFRNGILPGDKLHLDGSTVHRALVMGQSIVDYSGKNPFELPIETATEIALPLKMQDKMIGILYLASDQKIRYDRLHTDFFQLLSEVISSGIFNSRLYDDIERSYLQTVGALANAIEAKDPYTKGHSERVAVLSIRIADALGLSSQEKEHINFAALLHDVGKIGINRDILRKTCALDKGEVGEMRSHPDKGVQILAPVHFLKPVLSSIRHHHEQFDGTGYPLGLKGGEIPFKARILSVADTWDAMLSDRPYRTALSVEEAKEELVKHSGTQFDPDVVEALVRCLEE